MLIVIEGPDGAGKTAASKALATALGFEWMCFPDRTTPIGQLIDGYLKGRWQVSPADGLPELNFLHDNALVFQALQLANRTEHLPRLQRAADGPPAHLVLDRYWQSGYAYGKLDGLDPDYLIELHAGLPRPHLNILLDVPGEVSIARQRARGEKREHYERPEVLETVRANYLELWRQTTRFDKWKVVDANRPLSIVIDDLVRIVRAGC